MKKRIILAAGAAIMGVGALGSVQVSADINDMARSPEVYKAKELPKVPIKLKELPVKHPGKAPFADAQASQYKNYINWAYNVGITTGYTPTSYKPNYAVTRGEMAVFLHRLAASPSYTPPFNVYTDVTQYKNQILWLTATTVSNGTAPHYNPNGNVTRGQMAAFLHRMAKVSGKAPANVHYGSPFKDISGNMFQNDIGWLYSQGITTGYTPTTYNPNGSVTRGEMAAFLNRFYNKTVGSTPTPGREEMAAPKAVSDFAKKHKLTLGKFYKGENNGDLGQYHVSQSKLMEEAAQAFLLGDGSPFSIGETDFTGWESYSTSWGSDYDIVKFY